jgi:hypothetical protein
VCAPRSGQFCYCGSLPGQKASATARNP